MAYLISKCNNLECSWRSFPYRKPFQVRYFVFVSRRAVPLHLQSFLFKHRQNVVGIVQRNIKVNTVNISCITSWKLLSGIQRVREISHSENLTAGRIGLYWAIHRLRRTAFLRALTCRVRIKRSRHWSGLASAVTSPCSVSRTSSDFKFREILLQHENFVRIFTLKLSLKIISRHLDKMSDGQQIRSLSKCLQIKTRKLCYRKDDRAIHLVYECPESFWMCIENLKCVSLAVPEIIAIRVLVGGCEP